LVGIPPAPRGVPQVEVSFDIDANGIVNVSAKDLGTKREQNIRIESSSGLSDTEIEQMIKDAEQHSEEDKQKREEVELRNQADSLIYTTEQSLQEYGDKISPEDKGAAESAIEKLKETLNGNDIDQIRDDTDALMASSHKLAEAMYAQAAADAAEPTAEEATTADEDETIIDVEGEVVDDSSDDEAERSDDKSNQK
jgi:molecular chaperone DnaK